MDCGVSPREGDQQPVCLELGGRTGKRNGGSAGDAGREEGEVNNVLQQLVNPKEKIKQDFFNCQGVFFKKE